MANNFLLAYSFDEADPLSNVPNEFKALKNELDKRCAPVPLPRVTPNTLTDRIIGLRQHLLILHFAGHAHSGGLQTHRSEDAEKMTYINLEHFGDLMQKHSKGLKLVFLNGCATQNQAKMLREKGIPAVIAAKANLNDLFAFRFSTRFYELLFATGMTLQEAFDAAIREFLGTQHLNPIDASGRIHPDFLDETHRGMNEEEETITENYFYFLEADQEVRNERVSDWLSFSELPEKQIDLDAPPSARVLVDEDAYLLCDRKDETRAVEEHILTKAPVEEPPFLFVSADYRHLPYDLIKRYEKHNRQPFVRSILLDFPDPGNFDLPADPDKPNIQLKREYVDKGLLTDSSKENKRRIVLPSGDFSWIVHKLPAKVWKDGIKTFFEYYIGSFFNGVEQTGTGKYAIVCWLSYREAEMGVARQYSQLFDELSKRYKQVRHLGSFKEISEFDIDQWYYQIFGKDLVAEEYHEINENMYMIEARKQMISIIRHEQAKAREKVQWAFG